MHYAYTYVYICIGTYSFVCTVYLKNSLIPKIEIQRCQIRISFKYFAMRAIFLMYLHVIVACSYSSMLLILNTNALLTYLLTNLKLLCELSL